MKIAIVDTYYGAFLSQRYGEIPQLRRLPYEAQRRTLLDSCFGTSDFYSRHLNALGCPSIELIVNAPALQAAWSREHGRRVAGLTLKIPHRLHRVPLVGRLLTALPGLIDIAWAQVRAFSPDVLYCQDLSFFTPKVLKELKKDVGLIVGQIASPLPPVSFLTAYDLILTSFPHFVPRLRALGVQSEYFRIGFEPDVLRHLGAVDKDIDFSFVGGISRHHGHAIPIFEYLAENTPIRFFGYGADSLSRSSPIVARHHGPVWGLEMYRTLARSRITINRHIDVAENNANNMRLYEATGVGTLLLTDMKDNLHELFEIGKEVVVYSDKQEAAELARHYLAHPAEAMQIAAAGQVRTLREHTYRQRMEELVPILRRYLER